MMEWEAIKLNKEKELEKAIDELFVLFKNDLEREIEIDWNNAEMHENELIRVTINKFPFEVDFRHKPRVLITYFTAPDKKDYNRVDVEYIDGKWGVLDYSEWKTHGDFNEFDVRRVIKDYIHYVKVNK